MNESAVREKIVSVLTTDFRVPPEKIRDDGSFRGTFGLDSLDVMDFLYLLEKAFGIKAAVKDFSELHTLAAVVAHVTKLVNAQPAT